MVGKENKTGSVIQVLWYYIPKINMSPEKEPFQKERIVFQPSFFRGVMLVSGRVYDLLRSDDMYCYAASIVCIKMYQKEPFAKIHLWKVSRRLSRILLGLKSWWLVNPTSAIFSWNKEIQKVASFLVVDACLYTVHVQNTMIWTFECKYGRTSTAYARSAIWTIARVEVQNNQDDVSLLYLPNQDAGSSPPGLKHV